MRCTMQYNKSEYMKRDSDGTPVSASYLEGQYVEVKDLPDAKARPVLHPGLTVDHVQRYPRHMVMPDIGPAGQASLLRKSVLVVGAGGLGSAVVPYLAAVGIGKLGIADGDVVEKCNLNRQVIHNEQRIGRNKAMSAKDSVEMLNSGIGCIAYPYNIDGKNGLDIIQNYDIVVDATDSVLARYVISDCCVAAGKPLVSAACVKMDGQVTTYNWGADGPCYRCIHPVAPPVSTVMKCVDHGVLGAVVGVIGCCEAIEVVKIACGMGPSLDRKLFWFEGKTCTSRTFKLRSKMPDCLACGRLVDPRKEDYVGFCEPGEDEISDQEIAVPTITCQEYKNILERDEVHNLLDVRELSHFAMCHLAHARNIPLSILPSELPNFATTAAATPTFIICRNGTASLRAARQFRAAEFPGVAVIEGGLNQWSATIDGSFPVY